ncbi:hypothetical protein ACJRO7_008101 [Eucalyptus globulus]|uniref:FAD/NAD(P)-binding domain-containing protein n=1 Tax=Eucalyptus globulus TaxID=34317 RepID=A0ABD3IQ58_EUCGL
MNKASSLPLLKLRSMRKSGRRLGISRTTINPVFNFLFLTLFTLITCETKICKLGKGLVNGWRILLSGQQSRAVFRQRSLSLLNPPRSLPLLSPLSLSLSLPLPSPLRHHLLPAPPSIAPIPSGKNPFSPLSPPPPFPPPRHHLFFLTIFSTLSFYKRNLSLQRPRVCILGGGFGGLYTALRLESLLLLFIPGSFIRKVELLLGYFVRNIRKSSDAEDSFCFSGNSEDPEMQKKSGPTKGFAAEDDVETFILELQPAQRGLRSQILEADLVLWTVGSKPSLPELEPWDKPHELPLTGHPRIFALGDYSALRDSDGKILPATAQVAFQQADSTGWNLWAAINDHPLLPFRFQNLGEMMTLGRNDAAISPSFIDGLTLEGPVGYAVRKFAYPIRLPTDKHQIKVGMSWLAKSAIDSVASLQSTLTRVLAG